MGRVADRRVRARRRSPDAARLALAGDGYLQPQVKVDARGRPANGDAEAVVSVDPGERSAATRRSRSPGTPRSRPTGSTELLDGRGPRRRALGHAGRRRRAARGLLRRGRVPQRPDRAGHTPARRRQATVLPVDDRRGAAVQGVVGGRHGRSTQIQEEDLRTASASTSGTVYTGAVATDGARRLTDSTAARATRRRR